LTPRRPAARWPTTGGLALSHDCRSRRVLAARRHEQ
jgi:hypothetical protein